MPSSSSVSRLISLLAFSRSFRRTVRSESASSFTCAAGTVGAISGVIGLGGSGRAATGAAVVATIAIAPPSTVAMAVCFAFMVETPGVGSAGTIGIGGTAKDRFGLADGGLASAVGVAGVFRFACGIGKTYFSVAGIGPSIGLGRDADASGARA